MLNSSADWCVRFRFLSRDSLSTPLCNLGTWTWLEIPMGAICSVPARLPFPFSPAPPFLPLHDAGASSQSSFLFRLACSRKGAGQPARLPFHCSWCSLDGWNDSVVHGSHAAPVRSAIASVASAFPIPSNPNGPSVSLFCATRLRPLPVFVGFWLPFQILPPMPGGSPLFTAFLFHFHSRNQSASLQDSRLLQFHPHPTLCALPEVSPREAPIPRPGCFVLFSHFQ